MAWCVVIADAARARIYAVISRTGAAGDEERGLAELSDLINAGRRLPQSEQFSEPRPGSRRGAPGGPAHAVDDHRDAHIDEDDRRFAGEIMDEVVRLMPIHGFSKLLLVAPPRMLGFLRRGMGAIAPFGLDIKELGKDYSRLTPTETYMHIASEL